MSLSSLESPVAQRAAVAKILGMATAVPEHSITQADAAIVAQQLQISERWGKALPALYRKSGVQRRGSVLLGPELGDGERQTFYRPATSDKPFGPTTAERMQVFSKRAGPILRRACAAAIERAGLAEHSISHLVTVSCTGFFAPGVDIEMIDSLGLDSNIQRTHVGFMGCHGAINGIRVAKAIVDADPSAVVLLGAVELCSLHQQYTDDAQQLVANSLFADGAASLVIGSSDPQGRDRQALPHPKEITLDPNASHSSHWSIIDTFSKWIPGTSSLMSWTIGDYGFRMTLDPQVPSVIEKNLECELREWLEGHSLSIADIEAWAIHPGGPRIIQATGSALGLPASSLEGSLSILGNHGNMSSPTVLFILEHLSRQHPNADYGILLAFGPGLCIEAVLLKSTTSATACSEGQFCD